MVNITVNASGSLINLTFIKPRHHWYVHTNNAYYVHWNLLMWALKSEDNYTDTNLEKNWDTFWFF